MQTNHEPTLCERCDCEISGGEYYSAEHCNERGLDLVLCEPCCVVANDEHAQEIRDPAERARELIDAGYMSTSNKFRTVNRVPVGMTALEALRIQGPTEAARLERQIEQFARSILLRQYNAADELTLSPSQFRAFRLAGGCPA
jgi:hypothetical protein